MRLDKLTIGSAKDSPTHQFKNLKNVTIDFDQDHWVTVVIGWNGTGKSNVLEALAIIFRDLIAKKRTPAFAFQLAYRMGAGENLRHIHLDADPDREKEPFTIHVATDAQARCEGTLTPFIEGEAPVSALRGKATRLEGLDFNFASRDRLEQEYLRARFDLAADGDMNGAIITPENKQKALDALVQSLLRSLQEGQA